MEIRDLQFFCMTAELEHVTKAADRLGVAQPFLTRIIGQLEKEVGVALFDNVGRKIRLNEYGEVFYTHAKKILTELENLRNDMDDTIEHNSRTLKIMTNLESHYPEIVMAYQKAKPEYSLAILTASRRDIMEALKTGDADFGICSPPLENDPEMGIVTETVFCERSCVMLPPDHPMLSKRALTFDDMESTPLVTTLKDSGLRINLNRVMEQYDSHPQIVCESNDISMIIRAVKSGLGFAVLPRTVMFSIPSIKKYCVESALPESFGYIGVSYSTTQSKNQSDAGFVDFVKELTGKFYDDIYVKGIEDLVQQEG